MFKILQQQKDKVLHWILKINNVEQRQNTNLFGAIQAALDEFALKSDSSRIKRL